MSLATQIAAVFQKAWLAYGKPTIAVVPPVADWSLPAGYAYEDSVDAIQTAGGATITDLDALAGYYASDVVYIVPSGRTADLDVLIAAGVVPSGTIEVYVLQADVATIRESFAVQVNGEWYTKSEAGQAPVGHSTGIWAKVRLTRRT